MNVHEEDIVEISRKLTKMTDGSKSMDDAVELVTVLENIRVNIDLLSKTRIGTVLNDFRRKINDEKLAKRCKALIRKWEAEEEEEELRHKLMKKRSDKEEAKERPSFVPSGALAKESGSNRRADKDRRERDRGRERREQHHHHHHEHHHEHRRKSGRRGGGGEGEPPPGGWDKPKWEDDTVKKEEQEEEGGGEEAEKQQQRTGEEKEKPSFVPSGKLAKDTNTYKGVLIKYNEPPEAKLPKLRWRLYPFKGDDTLPVFYIHRQSAYLIGRDRKIADFPVDHPSCSKQHAALQYRSLQYERSDGSIGRRTRPYIIDLGSGNGTFLNGDRIEAQRYYELREKDVLRFGFSSREYVLLHEHSAAAGADEAEEDTSADEGEEEDEVMDGLVDRTGGEERIAAAEEDDLF